MFVLRLNLIIYNCFI